MTMKYEGCLPVPVVFVVLAVDPVGEDGPQEVALLPPTPLPLLQVNLNMKNVENVQIFGNGLVDFFCDVLNRKI